MNSVLMPNLIEEVLEKRNSWLFISVSGGKDSQAMLNLLVLEPAVRANWRHTEIIHADLGRAEWPQTMAFVKHLAEYAGLRLRVVQRAKGDLVDRIGERMEALAGTGKPAWPSATNRYCTSHLKQNPIDAALRKPAWPSASNRYCTSDLKRGPIETWLRSEAGIVISAEGVRAEESKARAQKPVFELRPAITSKRLREMPLEQAIHEVRPGERLGITWRPILHHTEAQVWQACGTSIERLHQIRQVHRKFNEPIRNGWRLYDWPCHPAYVLGNQRLSCALCVLAGKGDLTNGANHNPELYRHYLDMERASGFTFKNGFSLASLPVEGKAREYRDEHLAMLPDLPLFEAGKEVAHG